MILRIKKVRQKLTAGPCSPVLEALACQRLWGRWISSAHFEGYPALVQSRQQIPFHRYIIIYPVVILLHLAMYSHRKKCCSCHDSPWKPSSNHLACQLCWLCWLCSLLLFGHLWQGMKRCIKFPLTWWDGIQQQKCLQTHSTQSLPEGSQNLLHQSSMAWFLCTFSLESAFSLSFRRPSLTALVATGGM